MVFCIAKSFKLENVTYVRKLSISQLANIIQSDTIFLDFLVGETWGYKINIVNKCGTASLVYFKHRAALCCYSKGSFTRQWYGQVHPFRYTGYNLFLYVCVTIWGFGTP